MNINPLDWLLSPSAAKIAAAKIDLQRRNQLGQTITAGDMDPAHQIALRLALAADAKARNPLLGDMPGSNSPLQTAAPGEQGGIWSDAEEEQRKRLQAGGLRAPVLESLGLIPKPK